MTEAEFIYIEKTRRGYRLYFDGEVSDIYLSIDQVKIMLGDEDFCNFLKGKEMFNVASHNIPRGELITSKKNRHTKNMFK